MYNITNLSTATDLGGLFTQINLLSGQLLFSLLTVVLFVIFFVNFQRNGTNAAFGASSLITAIIASLFYAFGLIPFIVLFAFYIMAGIGAVILYFNRGE